MKIIKTFETKKEAYEVMKALGNNGISGEYDSETFTLLVHVSDFIKARDVIIECQAGQIS